jgi:D-alanyl-D-alanine carboxypeptidase (penicillin-binding protein 5/6)
MVQAAVAPWSSRQANAEEAAPALNLEVKSAILMEATTGQVLYENNADVALPPASMAKMMTEYLVMEAIKSGKIKWTDMVPVSERAAKVGGSGQMLGVGQQYTVEKIFQELSIYSGNDGAVALAEFVGGSEDNFAKMMNAKAKELGMSANAHFISATGLSRKDLKEPPAEDGETLMTARDAATLAYNILKDDKDTILKFTKIPAIKFRDTDKDPMINWNWMLEGNSSNPNFKKYAYPGLDGLKTGSTDDAGYCFTATAERNGMRLISVVMGTKSEPKRFEETRKVLDYGFNNFEFKKVLDAGKQVDQLKTVAIKKGIGKEVPVETKDSVTFVVKKGTKDDEIKLAASPIEEAKLVAPIQKGQKLGTLKISYGTQEKTVDLVASQDMQKASWIRLLFRAIGGLFADLFGSMKKAL